MIERLNTQRNRDLLATLINQLWRLISGPVIMILVPLFLTEGEQGYWYLFSSLSALSIFADLGFSNIILQFSAHEYAYLKDVDGMLVGDEVHLGLLGSFFKFSCKWVALIVLIAFPIIYIIGIYFFLRDTTLSIYIAPWTIYSIGALCSFLASAILSFLEGLDKVEACQRIRFITSFVSTSLTLFLLIAKVGIFASAFALLTSSLVSFVILWRLFSSIFLQLKDITKHNTYPWKKEILPLFSRYAISFSSSYFIFQIYTPLMHFYYGPALSGKAGITNALVMAVFSISNSWMYSIIPHMNILISRHQWKLLDLVFKKRLLLSCLTYVFGVICLIVLLYLFPLHFTFMSLYTNRFLPITSVLMLVLSYLMQLIVTAIAQYLRAHKQEPFVLYSIVVGIYTLLTTIILGKHFRSDYFFAGLLTSYLFGLPWAMKMFFKLRKNWHYGNV